LIPTHFSGCGEKDLECFKRYQDHFNEMVKPVHDDFNQFLQSCGESPYQLGEFFESSPYMNLLLYPEPLQYQRQQPLDPTRFQYLEGCVRRDEHYDVPEFKKNSDAPLLYLSFGSLGSGDTELLQRMIRVLGGLNYRVLVNIGDYADAYDVIPDNIHIASWYPQPSVIEQCDAVIHHGGNNSFTECLYFGKPALIMPYVWDGHDNATRIHETGHGLKMHRSNWTDDAFAAAIETLLTDTSMRTRLDTTSAHMKKANGRHKAAQIIDGILRKNQQ